MNRKHACSIYPENVETFYLKNSIITIMYYLFFIDLIAIIFENDQYFQ